MSFRYRRLDLKSVPGGLREVVPLQPVEARVALPPHVGWQSSSRVWHRTGGR